MTADPFRLVILSDTHLAAEGRMLYGLDPQARLAAAIEVIERDHRNASALLIAGDLTHWGEEDAYRALAATLEGCSRPVILMMGNHDRRAPFRAVFGDAHDDADGFVQGLHVWPQMSLITLDTLDEDGAVATHEGYLCPRRLGFLERMLAEAPTDRPLVLAQHHPGAVLGLPAMDRIRLASGAEELAVFERAGRRPDLILHGHVHRPVSGVWAGIPFHIQRALSHQVHYDEATADGIPGTHEPPDLAVLSVIGDTLAVHSRSFLYDGPVFSMAERAAIDAASPEALPAGPLIPAS
ncbi:MAG: metallophosphoesterase [Pseudomonadota bacterium]